MIVIGVGLDLVDLKHFGVHYGGFDPELLARCFTERELAECGEDADRLEKLAGRFAAKEATFKALSGADGVSHLDIETVRSDDGSPTVRLSGAAERLALTRGVTAFLVSISHSPASAGAVVIACIGPA